MLFFNINVTGQPLTFICTILATFLQLHDFLYAVPMLQSTPENHNKIPCCITPHMVPF